jgi:hypothetical protein
LFFPLFQEALPIPCHPKVEFLQPCVPPLKISNLF